MNIVRWIVRFIPQTLLSAQLASTLSVDKKPDIPDELIKDDVQEIEQVDIFVYKSQTDLSGIEATAASKAAWLVSIVVSIGGLWFGEY